MSEFSESRIVDNHIEITRYEVCPHLSLGADEVAYCWQCGALVTADKKIPYLEQYDNEFWASVDSAQDPPERNTRDQSKKSIGTFIVHSCFTQMRNYQGWRSQKRPKCRCRLRIDEKKKQDWLDAGLIVPLIVGWETNLTAVPQPTLSDKEFVYARRQGKTPRTPMIDAKHIHRAYDDNKPYAKERIEEVGRQQRNFLKEITAKEPSIDQPLKPLTPIPQGEKCLHGLRTGQCVICKHL